MAGLSASIVSWTHSLRVFPQAFPSELSARAALALAAALMLLGPATFAAARGLPAARLGAVFGLVLACVGYSSSRWPHLARAIELSGGTFIGPFLAAVSTSAVALTAVCVAAVLLFDDARPHLRSVLLAVVSAWLLPTVATEAVLLRWWGFGPRTLCEVAAVPGNAQAESQNVVWLYASRGRSLQKESVRMAAENVDLSERSLVKLENFLLRAGYRHVFALEALAAVRQGWRQWWEADRALDALTLAVPGRVHPDYRRALDLIKAGPLNAARYDRLESLAAEAARSPAGFEDVAQTQYIFEGFSAAYARFGDEAKARKWLYRIDNLWPVSEKKIEVTPVEDFREGRVRGTVLVDGRASAAVRVGLFLLWTSSGAAGSTTSRLLSASTYTDDDGRFVFTELGPGRYCLALMARLELLRGRILGSPGEFELSYDRPSVLLPPVRVERELADVPEAFVPGGLREPALPSFPERPLRWPRR